MSGEAPDLFDVNLERFVLGAILVDPSRYDLAAEDVGLLPGDFYRTAHAAVFRHMGELVARSVPIELGTLADSLRRASALEDVGGLVYLTALIDGMPLGSHMVTAAQSVKDYGQRRRAQAELRRALAALNDPAAPIPAVLDAAVQNLLDASAGVVRSDYLAGGALVAELLGELQRIDETANQGVTGVPSGLLLLDKMTAGFQRGDLTIIAARPSMGKTSLATVLTWHVLTSTAHAVAFFSLEMSRQQVMMRLLSLASGVDLFRLRAGLCDKHDQTDVGRATAKLEAACDRLAVDDTSTITLGQIRARVRRMQRQGLPIGLVVVDYIGLMGSVGRHDNRVQELGAVSRGLKALAKDFALPVIALSQLSRNVDSRSDNDHKPVLSDLRDSGELEQDADVVLFPYRPAYYEDVVKKRLAKLSGGELAITESDLQNEAEIIVAKQRNGKIGTVPLYWDASTSRFADRDLLGVRA